MKPFKYFLPLFLVLLMLLSVAQPIFATCPDPQGPEPNPYPEPGDIKIRYYLHNDSQWTRYMQVKQSTTFKCKLLRCGKDFKWYNQGWRWIKFYLFSQGPDGSLKDFVWFDGARSNLLNGYARSNPFIATKPGNYTLITVYSGGLGTCYNINKIIVF